MREETTTPREGVFVVVVDLRDAEAWDRTGRELRSWGRKRTVVHTLDNDHGILEFRAGGALEASA